MSHPFDEPDTGSSGGGDRFSAEDAKNRRLIVVPIEYVSKVRTVRGDEPDAIRINVVDLQANGGPQVYNGALWFGNRLIGAFRRKIGSLLVGYVTKEKVSGGFEAWTFISLTSDPQTVQLAQSWLQQHPEFMDNCRQDISFSQQTSGQQQLGDPWQGAMPDPVKPALPPLQPVPGLPPVQPQAPQGPVSNGQPTPMPATNPAPGASPLPPIGAPQSAPPVQQQSVPPAPVNPGMSVMDRLRQQAEEQAPEGQQQQYPF